MKITINEIKMMVSECIKRLLKEDVGGEGIIPHMEQASNPCNIMLGRFQPFTLGHLKCLNEIYNQTGMKTLLFVSPGKGDDKKPFAGELQDEMLEKMRTSYPTLIADIVYQNGAKFFDMVEKCRIRGYEPVSWVCGTDREDIYKLMFSRYSDRYEYDKKLNLKPSFEVVVLKRDDDNISATSVREALKTNNKEEYEHLMPKPLWSLYHKLRSVLLEKENGSI